MATYSSALKVQSVASTGTTVGTNQYAITTYNCTNQNVPSITVTYGPGETIASSFTSGASGALTWTFYSGVILQNGM